MRANLGMKLGLSIAVGLMVSAALFAADDKPAIDEIVTPFQKDKSYLGIVVGISRAEKHQVFGYGRVTLEGKEQVPVGDTIFEIGSVTKVFIGTLLADQVLAGAVRLDDLVQKHLPKTLVVPRRDERDITLLHLATHASSLPVQPPYIALFALTTKDPANPYAEYGEKPLARTLAGIKLTRPIGGKFEYSNLGVGLLGHALAHAGKAKDYEELLVERILGPLELADTRLQLSVEQEKRLVPGHSTLGLQTSPWTFASLEAAGGLRSTTDDLLTFADAALSRRKHLSKAFQMAHDSWRELGQPGEFIGLCWFRQRLPSGRTMHWHNGGTGGYRSFFAIIPETGLGVVVLSNSAHSVDELGSDIVNHFDKRD